MAGFRNENKAVVVTDRDAVRIVQAVQKLRHVAGSRVKRVDASVSAMFQDIEQCRLERTPEFPRTELVAGLAEINRTVATNSEVVRVIQWNTIDFVKQRQDLPVRSDALDAEIGVGDEQ